MAMDDATKEMIKKLSAEERAELLTELGIDPAKVSKDSDFMKTCDAIMKRLDMLEGKKVEKKKTSLLDDLVSAFTGRK